MEITYLSKIYYHSKFQGTVLSGGYASVTTFFPWLACWFCSKQLRDTRNDIQSCSVCSSVTTRQNATFTVLESVHAPKKPVCDDVCELPDCVRVCVLVCSCCSSFQTVAQVAAACS